MLKKIYILLASIVAFNTALSMNLECVHATIHSAIIEANTLEEYQTAWQDISRIYLESQEDLTPVIEQAIHKAEKYKEALEHKITDTTCPWLLSPDKLKIACGAGKIAAGAYLAVGLVVLPLHHYGKTQSDIPFNICFPVAYGIKNILYALLTRTKYASIPMETCTQIERCIAYVQWLAALPVSAYLIYSGMNKIDNGIYYTDRLKNKVATLDLIIAYMQTQHEEFVASTRACAE